MIIGTVIPTLGGVSYYSPTFGRGGLATTFSCETFAISGGASFAIAVEHKNGDETAWTALGSFSAITAAGISTLQASSIREQLRFKYVLTGAASTDSVYFNMLAPAWRPY